MGTDRRIRYEDLLHFKKMMDKVSQNALDELVKQAQDLNMGY